MALSASSEQMQQQYMPQFKELVTKTIDEQTKAFLRAFVVDFQGKFEQVLDLAEDFRSYTTKGGDGQLDEHQAHIFLEKKGEAATVVEFREKMKQIDLDFNKRVSVLEYLLYKYKKSVKDLFEAKPNAALIKQLEDAIEKYQAVFRAKKEREEKITQLESVVAAGGKDAPKAKAELMNLKSHDQAEDTSNEISALAAKLKAKRALANPDEEAKRMQEEAFKEEQVRVAEEQRRKDLEEKRKQDESRQRLKDKAKLWS
eukprot:Phypoly_transcript_05653.p2 GENE.Phypoly_transcript_05653~~Phypoly_transcript_05653.p2  ORF type:complete len:257 (-),score=77.63 Phypoly_transcript_05653:1093-1863(-)